MTETIEINAEVRTLVGKSSRTLGAQGKLPAVVYGVGVDSKAITIDRHKFEQIALHTGIGATLFKLSIDGHKPLNVMVKDVSHDPTKGTIQHVDFWAIKMTQTITTVIPINYVGDSVGEKAGGVLLHELREVHIESLPTHLPEHIDVDVSDLEVGMSLHIRDLAALEGVTFMDDPDTIICAVTAPTKAIEEEAVEEVAEPEVIGEKPEGE
ncbi:MAG: 50S ribosomal protein L25 [Coriobacteriia bacterium]